MKSHQEQPQFKPVTLILETQAEVDSLFALFNHHTVTKAVELDYQCYQSLLPFKSDDTERLHKNLTNS